MYVVDEELPIDEDLHHEFKTHSKNMLCEFGRRCSSRLNNGRIVRTMQPNSKTICAFLNTDGGRLVLGVDDLGIVSGMQMTKDQRDHFLLSLDLCLKSFQPEVPSRLIKVWFDELQMKKSYDPKDYILESDSEDGWSFDDVDAEKASGDAYNHDVAYVSAHSIASSCVCSKGVGSQLNRLYVITVDILKSDDGTIYQNEEGLVYQRRHGSNRMITIDKLKHYLEQEEQIIERHGPISYTSFEPSELPLTENSHIQFIEQVKFYLSYFKSLFILG